MVSALCCDCNGSMRTVSLLSSKGSEEKGGAQTRPWGRQPWGLVAGPLGSSFQDLLRFRLIRFLNENDNLIVSDCVGLLHHAAGVDVLTLPR
jgi:hypothetical protein